MVFFVSIIGTSSLRRTSQLRLKYPELVIKSIRGNLNTRLKKLEDDADDGNYFDAIVLAGAGVYRMDFKDKIGQVNKKIIIHR